MYAIRGEQSLEWRQTNEQIADRLFGGCLRHAPQFRDWLRDDYDVFQIGIRNPNRLAPQAAGRAVLAKDKRPRAGGQTGNIERPIRRKRPAFIHDTGAEAAALLGWQDSKIRIGFFRERALDIASHVVHKRPLHPYIEL